MRGDGWRDIYGLVVPRRPIPIVLAASLVAALALAVAYRSWIGAQYRAVVVLSTTLETPVLTWAAERVTGEPGVEEVEIAGVPATLARPEGDGPWPAFVFLNGATELGRAHPDVQRLARGLARAGYLTLVPDLPGLIRGELGDRTVDRAVELAVATADRPDTTGRVALFGVSLGATIALLAAAEPALEGRTSVVVGIAPYTDLVNVIRLATTGYARQGDRDVHYGPAPFLSLAVARSIAAGLPAGPERGRLVQLLGDVAGDDPEPLRILEGYESSDPGVQAALELLRNRDPARFDALYAALPDEARATIGRLSPISHASQLAMPIELASAPRDAYFPVAESRNLAVVAPDVSVTVTEAFTHVIPRPSLGDPGDLFAFNAWAVRALRAARR
jgi:pimeloyl-ACP methyl ester carboxylesterase